VYKVPAPLECTETISMVFNIILTWISTSFRHTSLGRAACGGWWFRDAFWFRVVVGESH